jgi:hypothetical protein
LTPAQPGTYAALLAGLRQQAEMSLALSQLVLRADAAVHVWLARVHVRERKRAHADEQLPCQRDPVATTLAIVNTHEHVSKHRTFPVF